MENRKWQYDFDFAINLNRWSMRFFGLWPIDDDRLSEYRFYLAFFFMLFSVIPVVIYCVVSTNILKDLDAVLLNITFITNLIKLGLIRIHKQQLKSLMKHIFEDWENVSQLSTVSQSIMVSNAKHGRNLNLILITFLYSSTFFYLITPIFLFLKTSSDSEVIRVLPLKSYYLDDFKSSPIYELLYILQCISGFLFGTAIVSVDCFLATIIFHLCGQLDIVAHQIENINGSSVILHPNFINIQDCISLQCITEHHIQIIRNSEVIQETFSMILLIMATGNVFVLCIQGYTIVGALSERNFFAAVCYILYIIFSTFNVFIYCYIGERLIAKSTFISEKLYEVKWYDSKLQFTRLIVFILIRSQTPLQLTAGKFFSMSLATYKNIMMTTFSYISFLQALNKQ